MDDQVNLNEIICDYFKDHKLSPTGVTSFLNQNNNIKIYCSDYLIAHPQYQSVYKFIKCLVEHLMLGKCKYCNNTLTYAQTFTYHNLYCSSKCASEDEDRKNKVQSTFIKKYNATNSFKSKTILDKIKKTNVEKYGVDNPFKSTKIQTKIKQTVLQKYGVENIQQNSKIRDKVKQTNMLRYGVQNSCQNQFVKLKQKQTLLTLYGSTSLNSDKLLERRKSTCLQKYGVENPNLHKAYNNLSKYKKHIIPLFNEQQYVGYNYVYDWKCVKCGNVFQQRLYRTSFNYNLPYLPRCLNCYPFIEGKGISNQEKELLEYIKSIYSNQILENDKQIISPYELDIVIPDKKVAIEFDGLYWHSDRYKQPNDHLLKTELCEQQGYKLIHIFEDEWLNKQDIIKYKIKSILNIDQIIIYARKCYIKELNNEIKDQFLNNNHIQGSDKSTVKLGLYYDDLLVAVMTFGKPRFNKNYQYELIRYATLSGYRVIGGAGKLLKYFERTFNPQSIITYADRRYSQGNMYFKLGFEYLYNSTPNYYWVKDQYKLTRYQTQKHKLKNILKNYNDNLTEIENMQLNNWNRIFDCGNMVFEKQYKE